MFCYYLVQYKSVSVELIVGNITEFCPHFLTMENKRWQPKLATFSNRGKVFCSHIYAINMYWLMQPQKERKSVLHKGNIFIVSLFLLNKCNCNYEHEASLIQKERTAKLQLKKVIVFTSKTVVKEM